MDGEVKKTANWDPGTLDKTRKNIGSIDAEEAANMAKKLGGEVFYERTTPSEEKVSGRNPTKPAVKQTPRSDKTYTSLTTPRRYTREELPNTSKRVNG